MQKNFKNILLFTALLLAVDTTLLASEGEKLFQQKCASCHTMTRPDDTSNMLAPPVQGLMYHMSEHFAKKEDIIKHINSFVMEPTKETAICRSVRRFGVMPSQKGLLTQEELNIIAHWMTKNMSAKQCKPKNAY